MADHLHENLYEKIGNELLPLPILEYAFLKTEEIPFSQQVREICRMECPRYNASWSCPPAVGTVGECRRQCFKYPECFIFTTAGWPEDAADFAASLRTRREHERITDRMAEIFGKYCSDLLVLSSDSCEICGECAWPDAPCRHPGRMRPCVESYGIPVPALAETEE